MQRPKLLLLLIPFAVAVLFLIAPAEFSAILFEKTAAVTSATSFGTPPNAAQGKFQAKQVATNSPKPTEKTFCPKTFGNVSILIIYDQNTAHKYKEALDSVRCYAEGRGYKLILMDPFNDAEINEVCKDHKGLLFRKHCAAAALLGGTDWLLVLDADTGVANPNRCIEEYINPQRANFESFLIFQKDMVFYERFHNGEVMAGNYLAKNSEFAKTFLDEWAGFESKMPHVAWHNSDNGAVHLHLLQTLFKEDLNKSQEIQNCRNLWFQARTLDIYDSYVGCCQNLLETIRERKKDRVVILKIFQSAESAETFRRGHGWARDAWTTGRKFGKEDFMLHAMKAPEKHVFTRAIDPTECRGKEKSSITYPVAEGLHIHSTQAMREVIRTADAKALQSRPKSIRKSNIAHCWPDCEN